MKVELLNITPLRICSSAIRTCWQSQDKSDNGGPVDKELIDRVGNKNKHSSTLEHIVINFHIYGISRACLQELSRHRMASLSVKSSRYTIKKDLIKEDPFVVDGNYNFELANKYVVLTEDVEVNKAIVDSLENLRKLVGSNNNDVIKYCMPEAFKTELAWTINARSLQNFLSLRTSRSALKEIRDLALAIYEAIPNTHKYIFKDCIAIQ